jgi:hypothetical protein
MPGQYKQDCQKKSALTLSVLINRSAVDKSEWRPCFLFLFIARL